jgi:putative DNA primase/helicase
MNANQVAAAMVRMDWRDTLLKNERTEAIRAILANALIALRYEPEWSGVLAFNEFTVRVETKRRTPWGKPAGEAWTDNDDRLTAEWLQKENIYVGTMIAGEAVQTIALENRFHPVRDYLDSLVWDAKPRLATWVPRYLGTDPNKHIYSTFGRKWLISAVARQYRPGCKADHTLILEGPQGCGKSSALRTLGSPWFTDQMPELGSKDSYLQIHGIWIAEMAELDSISRAETSRIKAFITAVSDRFRLPYGKNAVDWPRHCVFAGSTNRDDWNRDETGARRFWPVRCGRIDLKALERDRDQLWAEAVVRYREGEHWWLEDSADVAAAVAEQDERYECDPWAEKISDLISTCEEVSIGQILRGLDKPQGQWSRGDEMRVSAFLKSRGWTRVRTEAKSAVGTNPAKRPWVYRRPQ